MNNYISLFSEYCSSKLGTYIDGDKTKKNKLKQRVISRKDSQSSYEVIKLEKANDNSNFSFLEQETYNDDTCLINYKIKKNNNRVRESFSADKRKNNSININNKRKRLFSVNINSIDINDIDNNCNYNSNNNYKNVNNNLFIFKIKEIDKYESIFEKEMAVFKNGDYNITGYLIVSDCRVMFVPDNKNLYQKYKEEYFSITICAILKYINFNFYLELKSYIRTQRIIL
jgi:hypothetical protein